MITIRHSVLAAVVLSSFAFVPAPAGAALPAALQTVQENAQAAEGNAAHYQWKRVNWEVDRIVAAEHQWEQTQTPAASAALRRAVLSLRAARASHDAAGTAEAAREVAAQCVLPDK